MILNALAGKPLPVYGDGEQRARLAVRRRPLRGDPRACSSAAAPGETYNIGGDAERDEPRRRADDLRRCSTSCGRAPTARRAIADHASSPTGPATTAATRSTRRRSGASSAGRRAQTFETGLAQDGATGISTTATWCERVLDGALPHANGSAYVGAERAVRSRHAHCKGHHPRRRLRHAAVSADARRSASSCCRSTTSR